MGPITFKKILKKFSDPGCDIILDNETFAVQVNDQLFSEKIKSKGDQIFILIDENEIPALRWISKNLAKIDLLANRINTSIKPDPMYIFPDLNLNSEDTSQSRIDSFDDFAKIIHDHNPLSTGVIYLTSDAGEGKTSIVNEFSAYVSKKYIDKDIDFLIVPISLGGRTFHRLDDIVIGTLANKLRFPYMNYDSFIEMVKLRVIIPALDGFEEMFVETGTGEALSSMGTLLHDLDSSGNLIVSARKAYYEFENLKIQPKLFDVIRNLDVEFKKIDIERWSESKFINYLRKNEIKDAENTYHKISHILGIDHAILTRPVLAKKFVSLISTEGLDNILPKLKDAGNLFFTALVKSIVLREANEKWLFKASTDSIYQPILPYEDHYDLLARLSQEMWLQKKNFLNSETIEFVVDLYSESKRISVEARNQIRERIKGHALLVISKNDPRSVEFDHDEFKDFFLAYRIFSLFKDITQSLSAKTDLINVLRKNILSQNIKNIISGLFLDQNFKVTLDEINSLQEISIVDGTNSYLHQNVGDILIKVLSIYSAENYGDEIHINNYNFGINSLEGVFLSFVNFYNCYFSFTNLNSSRIVDCQFSLCNFETILVSKSSSFQSCSFTSCNFVSLEFGNKKYFDPYTIQSILNDFGVTQNHNDNTENENGDLDNELILFEKLLRYFLRSTHISESVIRMKLGNHNSNKFIDEILPSLIFHNLLTEIENKGGEPQQRFKLGKDMSIIRSCIDVSKGNFDKFLSECDKY